MKSNHVSATNPLNSGKTGLKPIGANAFNHSDIRENLLKQDFSLQPASRTTGRPDPRLNGARVYVGILGRLWFGLDVYRETFGRNPKWDFQREAAV